MEHYFSSNPVTKENIKEIKVMILGKEFSFLTSSSVFSKDKLDRASRILIENCRPEGEVLDLGCGYGAIGIILKKIYKKQISVTLSDINKRAIALAKKNAKINEVKVKIIESNLFEKIKNNFDTIISNPAFHAGREFVYKLIEESYEHLNKNGTLQIVATHNRGGRMIEKKMKELFDNVESLVKQGGIRVYCSKKVI